MNYAGARQLQDGPNKGKWHYTTMNDGACWPTGYCADDCEGHETSEEACEHQRQYYLDNLLFEEDQADPNTQHRCQAPDCDAFTSGRAHVRGAWWRSWDLCADHRNRETVDELLEPPTGWTVHS